MCAARALLALAALCGAARATGPGPPTPSPALSFAHNLYNLSVPENSPPRTYARQPPDEDPLGVQLPEPDAKVRFRIRHGDKDKFFKAEDRTVGDFCFLSIRTRAGHADVLNRERRDSYTLDVRATAQLRDGRTLEADATLAVTVEDENDLSPLFYPTEYEVTVPEDAPLHASVARVSAEDADLGLNGEIYYSLAEPTDRFAVHLTSGVVTLTRALSADEAPRHVLTVLAHDRASLRARPPPPGARARLTVNVARANLHAPRLRALPPPASPDSDAPCAVLEASDEDEGEPGRVAAVDIVDGDPDGHFRVRAAPPHFVVEAHALLPRRTSPRAYNLTLRARDAGRPPRASYLTLPVALRPPTRAAPVFARELYEASVPETVPPGTPVIRLKVGERDDELDARVYIEVVGGNEGDEFYVNPDTGVLYTAVPLDAEQKALYTLTVSAIDQGDAGTRQQSSAKVKITVLDSNDNDPVFEQEETEVTLQENGPSGAVVARVQARDADSGDNAYISYSIANLQPVPFDVDHFSGAVRTTRLLDYESMRREYTLRIRASDWGTPYRRQAETKLVVRLEDVNDNRPQFERVDCVGYLPRRLAIGSEIATLSAIDFDAGDVVSYRLIGGNEDNCFALDASTGVLSLACDLSDVRAESRVLNVTATDGTHFADAAALSLHLVAGGAAGALECRDTGVARRLTELLAAAERANAPPGPDEPAQQPSRYAQNLHAPDFIDFPVEVKVNESVALGTTLVTLKAHDRDLGYNGLLVYGISGGDAHSAFRIDPDTGELQVIGYLDRERESEYYLNVTVYDLGSPQRSVSRLLPVTVLDVNDNPPRFEKTLASLRVTENALNGTAIFHANATDRDAGLFGRVTYSLSGADGELCVEREAGVVRVCAALDRERRALYELVVRAVDGGGLAAEALVRVAVDDVNDNAPRFAPRFALGTFVARVREDVPVGALVAVVDAADADEGAAGRVSYSLPYEEPDDAVFTVDPTSGTLRTAKLLDFEEKPGYSVTVRATDGGQPALWSEVTVFVEVDDVDENEHAPTFGGVVLAGAVREDAARSARVMQATAKDGDASGRDSRLSYYLVGGSGMGHFTVDDAGVIRTLTPLDRETVPHYWLTLCAQDHGLVPRHACVRVYIDVLDVNDEAPWPELPAYTAEVVEHCSPGTHVATVRAHDGDASPEPANITYSIVAGNPDGLFSINELSGEVVTTGRTLDREAASAHALEVRCSDGALATTARVAVRLRDINDHAPTFAHRYTAVRVPNDEPAPHPNTRDDSSTEWDGDDDDEGSGAALPWDFYDEPAPQGLYIATVIAFDSDEGANGTVRYWGRARGAARGVLRVEARTGQVWATRGAEPGPGRALQLAVRACDMAPRPRCSHTRITVRGATRGGGASPVLPTPSPLQVTELDAPGFLLTVLQATDPDGDPLYYAIVGGDPRHEFYLGREDGSLVLARRLVWETQPHYALNVSTTDGLNVVYATVNITVINDSFEEGVRFERDEYVVEVSEAARVGEALGTLRARSHPTARLLYGVHAARAPASHKLFRLHELSAVLELAHPLDREAAADHELTVWVRDQAPRSSRAYARVRVRVLDADEHAPEWGRALAEARMPAGAAPGTLVAALRAWDRDVGDAARVLYSLTGGAGLFAVDALGDVRLARSAPLAPRSYTLAVRATNPPPAARAATLTLLVHLLEPDAAPPRFAAPYLTCEVYENEPPGATLLALDVHSSTSLWFSLVGGDGLFRINPFAGLLSTVVPLDYETQNFYNLTITAINMGGGSAVAHVGVHVLDRNEFAPRLQRREYRGRVSEAAALGGLVTDAESPRTAPAPLVLLTDDDDSPANQQRAFEIVPPAAATFFRIDAVTGALHVRAPLDYERAIAHEFTVRVIDMGSPRLPSMSVAKVYVEVIDVNDCPPQFSQAMYEATVLLPTWAGVTVTTVSAVDPDLPRGASVKYDIIEGDTDHVFAISGGGTVLVANPESLQDSYRLRVRASDGLYSSTARVIIRVREAENSGLAFQKAEYYGSMVENSTKPTTIVVVNVLGTALNEHVEFKILNPTEGFEMGATSGAVRSSGVALDREARAHYTLVLQAAGGGRVARARLHVALTDVNDNCPVFVGRPYAAAVLAGAEPGEPIITVKAVDADANDNGEVRYEMKRGNGELFRVDRRSGQISLKQAVEAHNQEYSLVVGAFDGGVPACGAEAGVSVRVWGGGAAPRWPRAHVALSVREDVAPGAPLGPPLRATSPLARALIYTLLHDEHGLFELHFETAPDRGNGPCVLVAREQLDYESAREHELVVRATDGVTGAYADVALTVQLVDVNDCAPAFLHDVYRAAVTEAAAPGDFVLTVSATDDDAGENGEISYSLSALDGTEGSSLPFAVDARTGEVVVVGALDREARAAYHLVVEARDAGRPALASTAHVFVAVDDVNDCAPRVERAVLAALVSGEAARGTELARVAAWDADALDAGRLHYALVGAAQRGVTLDPRTGVLAVREAGAAPRSLNVSVSDGAHAAFARVKLSPAPTNTAAPRFPHLVHETRALENQPPPLLLTTVKAYDPDAGEYGAVTYSIPSARLRETFAIDAHSGAVTALVALDREARSEWSVPVVAADGGGRAAHSVVRVRVLDLNDCAPRFPLREYHAAASHDTAPHLPLLTVRATDDDGPEHARLNYSLYEGDAPHSSTVGLLHIDPTSGALSFARPATDFEGRTVQVWVRAVDAGGLAGEAPVWVHVVRAGQRAVRPAPLPPALSAREDAPPGTRLADLRAPHPAPQARLRLAPATHYNDLFAIDTAGYLVLAGHLDRETAAEHVIGIIAEGSGVSAPATMVITRLHVLDVNEHAPSFHSQPYVVHVAENAPPHTSLVQLMADDPDSGSNGEVRYSLAEGTEGDEETPFAVDPYTGWVSTLAALDREARAEYRVALEAHDLGAERRSSRGTLVVRVLDYNDCAPRFRLPELRAEVREDAPAGTVLLRLDLLDDDASAAPLSFFVAEGDPRARFQLRASGELLVARALDRELEPRYELRVAATDGKFTATARVHVTVLDVNDNPPYCLRPRYAVRLPEDAANGTLVMTLETGDADEPANTHLRYFLTGEDAHHFSIDKEAGAVRVVARLDRETRAHYSLRAHAQDRERPDWACAADLLVTLDDVNDNAPRFSAHTYSVTLPEDADVGTLVTKVHATDADLGPNRLVRYSLVDDTGDGDTFDLAPDSGIVTLRAPLDRESQAEHRLVVRASDAGEPPLSATATLRLTVADVNDNPPEFEFHEYRATVSELDAPGTELLRVRATSRDAGVNADVYYALVGGDDRDHFAVGRSSGVLSVARPLDYERRRDYLLTVQAVDGGTPPLSDLATVNISLTDGNDNAPRFSQATYAARVREDAAPGTRILQLVADDADSGANGRVTYSLARGDRDGRFSLDPDTGYLSVAAPLDRETVALYVLEVHARDHGLPALDASARVNVEVVDANDNPPLFAQTNYSVVVAEDRPLGHTLLKFTVEDVDAPPNAAPYTFDFQSGNEMGAFRLEQDGYLRTATRFNHRIRDRYVLQVRVFDNGTPPLYSDAWVYVKVIEESQYPPVVTPLEVLVNSYLDEFPGGVIGRVIASDRDAYDTLTYSIAPADDALYPPTDLFEIDPADGTLRAAPRLDVGDYRLNVTVDDGKFLGFAIVKVTVLLVSDEMLAQAIVVRFREVTDRDFILSHRKGFLRAVSEATDCDVTDVVVISVQPSGQDEGERVRRQVAQDLDVAFCVRGAGGPLPADALRRRLHQHLERLEERARLVVEELLRAACGGCEHGACIERVELRHAPRALACDVFALVAPAHRLRARCACEQGYAGERCERTALDPAPVPTPRVAHLRGDGYLQYRVERGALDGARLLDDELTFSLRFRTRRERGTLLAAAGRVDYAVLEVAEGYLQFRMELGSGPAAVRAAVPVADGAWHAARLERRGASMRLTVDRRSALAHTPPPAAVLDARTDRLLIGATLVRHAHAFADEQVTYGFDGCISELKLGNAALPLEEGDASSDGRVQLVRRERVLAVETCPALAPPTPCASYPCLNGGSCRDLAPPVDAPAADDEGYACECHARFSGRRCELDDDPCASQPCLHGGACAADATDARGYRCACGAGLAGARCERGRWCGAGVCAHGGACEEGEAGPTCRCRGYWGARCQYDVDECAGEPCLNGATCLNEPGSFRCVCPPDRTGMNCGNPLYSDAVVAADSTSRALREAWRWACDARWPLLAAVAALLLLLALAVVVPLVARRARRSSHSKAAEAMPLNCHVADKLAPRASKMSNLEAVRRERPASCAEPPPLNNVDTLRSYGSAGDELEGIPPDYRRNLNIDVTDRKPWSEQMHLHTFVDNKIYNDLKGSKGRSRTRSPALTRRVGPEAAGVYHWDCSDWMGGAGALPGISEVAGSERPDSSSPASPPASPRASLRLPLDTDSAPDDCDALRLPDATAYLVCTDEYVSDVELRARTLREPDAASLITMLEERNSLLGCDEDGSGSELSANLCEIEESDAETEPARTPHPPHVPRPPRHTDV